MADSKAGVAVGTTTADPTTTTEDPRPGSLTEHCSQEGLKEQRIGQEDRTVVMYINPNFSKNLSVKPILILTGALGWVRKELPVPAIAPNSPRTGRLAQYTHNWAKITTDPWVLGQLSGHTLELSSTPTQGGAPKEFHLSQELDRKLEAEIQALVEKGAVSIAHPLLGEGFTSRMFVVPKKDVSVRPIIDLRELNRFIHWEHFKMEGIHLVKDLLQEEIGWSRSTSRMLISPSP